MVACLDIPQEVFSDRYSHANTADFAFDSFVVLFLYQYAWGFIQSELYRRMKGAAYVWIRLKDGTAYKFTTLSLVGKSPPIVLAYAPVIESSEWDDNPVHHYHRTVRITGIYLMVCHDLVIWRLMTQ